MTEDEILNMVRKECNQFMTEAGLTDNDVIIKKDQPMSKQEVIQHGFTHLEVIKRVGEFVIMVGKRGLNAVSIVVLLWQLTQFGSMLLFEKRLPDAVDLAQHARQGIIEFTHDIREQSLDTPEKWIVTSRSWENYDDDQYIKTVYDYTSGIRRSEELYTKDTLFIPTTYMSIEVIQSTSGSPKDFKV